MNQEAFQARHEGDWIAFENWLKTVTARRVRGQAATASPGEETVAHRYRVLCQHLALARDRQYSPGLVERLNALVMRGHQVLYGAHTETGPAVARFFAADFARAVRKQWRPIALAAALFFVPLFAVAAAIQIWPDLIHTLLPQKQILTYQEMYDPANKRPGQRPAQADTFMLGHYIYNNIKIGFQTFAGGLLFGLGSAFYLTTNGVLIGATAGHLIQIGFATSFLGFVAGHSALELSGIVLMGGAGLMLGSALLLPGQLARVSALRVKARAAVPLVYGAGALLTLAALVEAFWSPVAQFPPALKYAVGLALWLLLVTYFLLAGRLRAD
ncbi:MAG: stage II sporulation protein M [Betaproteobacteria bacterium]|nr:stage II sporulation protein M [Betaproteobacteria bacterium]